MKRKKLSQEEILRQNSLLKAELKRLNKIADVLLRTAKELKEIQEKGGKYGA